MNSASHPSPKLTRLVGILLSSGAALVATASAAAPSENTPKPNIVFIMADDLGYGDLSCYGQQRFDTPNLDRLAAEGMRFTQYYAGSTVCAPSRCALMTGRDTGHASIRGNVEVEPIGQTPLPDADITIAEVLKRAGYATGATGKWGLGGPRTEGDPLRQGFDFFYGFLCQRNAHHYYPPFLWEGGQQVMFPNNHLHDGDHYAPEMVTDRAVQFIDDHREGPFFLYVPFVIPHASLTAPDEEVALFRGKYDERPFVETSYHYRSTDEPYATFAAMVTILDRNVGRIVAALDELGLRENTVVMFTSDNGPHREGGANPEYFNSGGGLRGGKRDLYEGGIRVPFIARWPGRVAPKTTTDHVCAAWDVMPTLADMAGGAPPEGIQGVSYLPTLLGEQNQPEHAHLYWEFNDLNGRQAVRAGDWKLVRLSINQPDQTRTELYDLSVDPSEEHDLSMSQPEVVDRLMRFVPGAAE